MLDNLTDAIGLEFPKELAMRKALVTLKMAGFSEEKSKEILDRMPGQLSEGERHRVALAQVLIREPRIVILDEPTGTMDPITKIDVKHSIMHSREEMDETFIVVSHDMEFVRDICDRLALMRGGKIVEIGKTADVLAIPDRRRAQDHEPEPAPREWRTWSLSTLTGRSVKKARGARLALLIPGHPAGCAVAIIRPGHKGAGEDRKVSRSLRLPGRSPSNWPDVKWIFLNRRMLPERFPFTGRTGTRPHSGLFPPASARSANPISTSGAM